MGRSMMQRVLVPLAVVVSLAGIAMSVFHGPLAEASDAYWPLGWVAWPLVGWAILSRRPDNHIGWICLGVGVMWGINFALVSLVNDVSDDVSAWIELAYTTLGAIPWIMIVSILIVFPTGRYEASFERWLGRSLIVLTIWATLGFLFAPGTMVDSGMENPLGTTAVPWLTSITSQAGFLVVLAFVLAAIIGLFRRWRRSDGTQRLQFQWFLLGGTIFFSVIFLGQFLPEQWGGDIFWLVGGTSIPLSIGIAVTRYRLFEIDRIVSRTLSYALVVAVLAGVYFGVVALLALFVPSDNPTVVAGSTLVVAALFNPVRKRVQGWVDRRFNRSRFDTERVVEGFVGSLRDRVEVEDVVHGWVGVVAETMQPSTIGVWIRGNGDGIGLS